MAKNPGNGPTGRQSHRRRTIRTLRNTIRDLRTKAVADKKILADHQRDIQYMNKTLVRMNNLLKHVYSHTLIGSRGMKLLIIYYRMRDHLLPVESGRRRFFDRIIQSLNLDKVANKSPIGFKEGRQLRMLQSKMELEVLEQNAEYQKWIKRSEPSTEELAKQRRKKFRRMPLISIVVPVFDVSDKFLVDLLASVKNQTYANWQLCLSISGEQRDPLLRLVKKIARQDERIHVMPLEENFGISINSNRALEMAKGEYVTFLDHDDMLPPFALYEVAAALERQPDAEFIYSDEDKITADGKLRFDPYFKPDFSPDTLCSNNYICHLSVIKKSLLDKLKGFRKGFEGSQDYDLFLRAVERTKRMIHIPKVLYHWRVHEKSTAQNYGAKTYAMDAAKKALADHLKRKKITGQVSDGLLPTTYRVTYTLPKKPRVAIIIPTKDHADVLKTCVQSILDRTDYPAYTIYLVDTGSCEKKTFTLYNRLTKAHSNIKLLENTEPFNYSSVNNFAVKKSRGDVLLFLNNDMEVINKEWLTSMVEHAVRPEVGAVGAKLYYPDHTIQHGGVILGIRGIAGHSHKHFSHQDPGYFFRLKMIQNVTAVTAACLMMRRSVFDECKGFDEKYPLAFGDVDLCMKVRAAGKLVVWTPFAELIHHESKTRGYEDTPEKQMRFLGEQKRFRSKWGKELDQGDPYYNPNLTLLHEDFSIQSEEEFNHPLVLPFD